MADEQAVTVRVRPAPAIVVVAGLLLAVGSFLPWVTVTSVFGRLSRSGMEGGDGLLTLAGGVAAVVLGLVMWARPSRRAAVASVLLAVAIGVVLAFEFRDASNRMGEIAASQAGSFSTSSYGSGLWSCALGAVGALVGGAWEVSNRSE